MAKNPIQKNGLRPFEVRLPHAPLPEPIGEDRTDSDPTTGRFVAGNTAYTRRVAKFQSDVMRGMAGFGSTANKDPLFLSWMEYAQAYMKGLTAALPVKNDGTCALAREAAKFSAIAGYLLARAVREGKDGGIVTKDLQESGRWFDRHRQTLVSLAALAALPTGQKGDGGVADLERRLGSVHVPPPPTPGASTDPESMT